MRRRAFIAAGVGLTAVSCGRRKSYWRFFTAEEATTLAALCEQIIPEDQDPGAVQAGVVQYIDTQLTGFYKPLQKTYREGLALMKRKGFSENDPETKPFFDLVVTHTMQGFYGDPRHGGNRDRISWKMVGLPYPPIRGRLRPDEHPWL